MNLYYKHLLIRTPLEGPAKRLRRWMGAYRRWKHPELRELFLEDGRIEQAMRRIIRAESNCIDIGSHLGSTLSTMIKLAPAGRHIAFEPLTQKCIWLRKKFPDVEVNQVALGEEPGKLPFYEDLDRPGFSSLKPVDKRKARMREVVVDIARLDGIVPANRKIDFIKVDVEGAELLVLRGATGLLERDSPVLLFESGAGGADRFEYTRKDLFDFVTQTCGYDVYFVKDFLENGHPATFERFDDAHKYPFKANNYIAKRRSDGRTQ